MLKHTITHKDDKTLARRGTLELFHGSVQTPAFMPVGTVGAVKTLLPEEVKSLGAEIILGNTYHLYLRPGHEAIKDFGGIQQWNKWDGPVLTDSGGYQVFSLGNKNLVSNEEPADKPIRGTKPVYDADETEAGFVKITEEGALFRSHIDGAQHMFTPEKVIDIQLAIGSDIMMVLDDCVEFPASKERAKITMDRTHRWAKRAIEYFTNLKAGDDTVGERHNLFGIAQGSTYKELREESLAYIASLPFDGIAVGGVAVGEGKDYMYEVMDLTGPLLPEDKPHYLMGIGEPEDIIRAVSCGYDMFDCVLPTRLGRYGVIWKTSKNEAGEYEKFEKWDMRGAQFRDDKCVIDADCGCPSCLGGFSRAYIAHMLREREVVGIRLTTMHNLWTILELMRQIRQSLEQDTFHVAFKRFIA